jgi:hypothetical protein
MVSMLRNFTADVTITQTLLILMLDTKESIFRGFTPVEWESRVWNEGSGGSDNRRKADDSQRSFGFTLKNPNNMSARRFALKAEKETAGNLLGFHRVYVLWL